MAAWAIRDRIDGWRLAWPRRMGLLQAEAQLALQRPEEAGYNTIGSKGYHQWVPDWPERAILAEIVRLHDEEGRSLEVISDSVEQRV